MPRLVSGNTHASFDFLAGPDCLVLVEECLLDRLVGRRALRLHIVHLTPVQHRLVM